MAVNLATSVSFAGDMNADGYADIVVGATRKTTAAPAQSDKGALYVFYGSATGITSHPLLSASSYTCSGPTDCMEIQNPLHEDVAFFANSGSTSRATPTAMVMPMWS
jgi:hypothetical protein